MGESGTWSREGGPGGIRPDLRSMAEDLLRTGKTTGILEGEHDLEALLHELHVYHTELEIQNEELRQSQRDLETASQRYRNLFQLAPVGYMILDESAAIVEVNESCMQLLGLEGQLLRFFRRAIVPEDQVIWLDHVTQVLRSGLPDTCEVRCLRKGQEINVVVSSRELPSEGTAAAGRILCALMDVTQQRQAERQRREMEENVRHAQKLESLGILAGGLAHDFNNLLVGILGNADLALSKIPPESDVRKSIESVRTAAVRASELTNQMLAYSGKGQFLIQEVLLSEVVEEIGGILSASVPKNVELVCQFPPDMPPIHADVSQIRQVVMNLITNAADAIGPAGGEILVSGGTVQADREYISQAYHGKDSAPGRYVFLEVRDDGCGMNEKTKARLFDPFFTTKFAGRGLGLSALLGIVRGHSGAVMVESEPGEGSTFRVLFPVSPRSSGPRPDAGAPAEPADAWRADGTVLVVDDEETVVEVAEAMLEGLGLEVLVARDGQAAVELFNERADDIDLVLMDLTMPRMSGQDALREIRKTRPGVKAIITSGYSEQDVSQAFSDMPVSGFIQKPFRLDALTDLLGKALNRRA